MIDKVQPEEPLLNQIHTALETSPYFCRRQRLRCETEHGRVKLHGSVDSFFEKQMAQEIIRRVDGVETIENLLEVRWQSAT